MPHRSQELVALCFLCKAPAATACERCSRPLCAEHDPGGDIRCHSCEWTFHLSLYPEGRKMRRRRSVVGAVYLGMVAVLFWGGGPGVWPFFGGLSCLVLGYTFWVSTEDKRTHARLRRRFLRERKDQMLPGRAAKQLGDGPVE